MSSSSLEQLFWLVVVGTLGVAVTFADSVALLLIVLFVCIPVMGVLYEHAKKQEFKEARFVEAKDCLKDQGYKLGKWESVLIENGTVTFSPMPDDETTPEPLGNFVVWKFGEDIRVYVHTSGNLAFMLTKKDVMTSGLVFEK